MTNLIFCVVYACCLVEGVHQSCGNYAVSRFVVDFALPGREMEVLTPMLSRQSLLALNLNPGFRHARGGMHGRGRVAGGAFGGPATRHAHHPVPLLQPGRRS